MDKIAIFGGTGYTGLCALRIAVEKGVYCILTFVNVILN